MKHTITVHMIGAAHIDPVWLWRWHAGAVEALSTCRTAVELLEKHPSFVFTRSDVWVHELVERFDPALFERIRTLVAEDRWYPAGGWYIQPDCNLPTAASYRKHIDIGKRYFGTRFGIGIDVGYNVDSFGHNASLPDLLAESGYTSYVMMRPMAHEKTLPAELFRWRGAAGSEVTTWRIQGSYNASTVEALERNIASAVEAAVPGIDHVMCFYGVGDHGGGPTEELIEWIEAHTDYSDGVRLEFSHPKRFFAAVSSKTDTLEIVEGELQMHAIGCYTVVASMKRAVRNAEYALMDAEASSALRSRRAKSHDQEVDRAWKNVLFNEFHDTLGGSSIAEAYDDAASQLGGAVAGADTIIVENCLDFLNTLAPDKLQRAVAFNFAPYDYVGPIIHEPWIHPNGFSATFPGALLDNDGNEIDYQIVQQSAILGPPRALLFEARVQSGIPALFSLDTRRMPRAPGSDLKATPPALRNRLLTLEPGAEATDLLATVSDPAASSPARALCSLVVIDDPSDTWSHRIDRYSGSELGSFRITTRAIEESGPLRATIRVEALYGSSRLVARFRLYRGKRIVDTDFELFWGERFAVAKLVVPCPVPVDERTDAIPVGALTRPQDGKEYPFLGWTKAGARLAVVSPDCFAFDGSPEALRFTLVRSPVYAWHDPTVLGDLGAYRYTDQKTHRFRFRFLLDSDSDPGDLDAEVRRLHAPPRVFDWTKGM